MKILIIDGHPNPNSLTAALARAYYETAQQKGHSVELLEVRKLSFSPHLNSEFSQNQGLEPDLVKAQNLLKDAEHSVWVYPNWWGLFPSLLKGFIDRILLPGFAFKYQSGGFPEQLLKGRTAHVIMTLDTPVWIYRWIMGAPGIKIMKSAILGFCGIKVTSVKLFGPIRGSSAIKREEILLSLRKHVRNSL